MSTRLLLCVSPPSVTIDRPKGISDSNTRRQHQPANSRLNHRTLDPRARNPALSACLHSLGPGGGTVAVRLLETRRMCNQLTVPTVGRFRATGDAYLTTERVVFCASQPHKSQNGMLFKGFDIPLQMLSGEKFEQPILFGANNLSGTVQTNVAYAGSMGDAAAGIHATATPVINSSWRLSFRNGGFGTFLRVFYASLQRRRSVNPAVTAVAFGGSDDEWASMQVKKGNDKRVGPWSFGSTPSQLCNFCWSGWSGTFVSCPPSFTGVTQLGDYQSRCFCDLR
ncbi:unnamed protein product [Scytosiphon promiscuus]